MLFKVRTRLQAFAAHLAFSLVLFVILAAVILLNWYPDEHWYLGGLRGVAIIAAVDIILGPLLTLIIYNTQKKHLKLDVLCILVVQLTALTYGAWSINQGRPLIQVLTPDGMYIITTDEAKFFEVDMTTVRQITLQTPARVFLDLPEDHVERHQVLMINEFLGDQPIYFNVELYKGFSAENIESLKNILEYESAHSCYTVVVFSNTGTVTGCLETHTGKVHMTSRKN